mmetsp:Transcript_53885/g.96009  ORF Transcript_53885/g.96009 Transcript_53885/m.96009 type:complete len:334 (-) Transcript_53885:625-1626(-)
MYVRRISISISNLSFFIVLTVLMILATRRPATPCKTWRFMPPSFVPSDKESTTVTTAMTVVITRISSCRYLCPTCLKGNTTSRSAMGMSWNTLILIWPGLSAMVSSFWVSFSPSSEGRYRITTFFKAGSLSSTFLNKFLIVSHAVGRAFPRVWRSISSLSTSIFFASVFTLLTPGIKLVAAPKPFPTMPTGADSRPRPPFLAGAGGFAGAAAGLGLGLGAGALAYRLLRARAAAVVGAALGAGLGAGFPAGVAAGVSAGVSLTGSEAAALSLLISFTVSSSSSSSTSLIADALINFFGALRPRISKVLLTRRRGCLKKSCHTRCSIFSSINIF